jgi:hypothetical protein
MRAQRREARMTTMSGSMETVAEVEDDELDVGAGVVEWMRLAGVRMVWQRTGCLTGTDERVS